MSDQVLGHIDNIAMLFFPIVCICVITSCCVVRNHMRRVHGIILVLGQVVFTILIDGEELGK